MGTIKCPVCDKIISTRFPLHACKKKNTEEKKMPTITMQDFNKAIATASQSGKGKIAGRIITAKMHCYNLKGGERQYRTMFYLDGKRTSFDKLYDLMLELTGRTN